MALLGPPRKPGGVPTQDMESSAARWGIIKQDSLMPERSEGFTQTTDLIGSTDWPILGTSKTLL